jgi:hypothetical protein
VEHIFSSASAADFSAGAETRVPSLVYQTYQILRPGFIVAPILAGLDKYFHLLLDRDKCLPPSVNNLTGGHGHEPLPAVGGIEIAAGRGVAFAHAPLRHVDVREKKGLRAGGRHAVDRPACR